MTEHWYQQRLTWLTLILLPCSWLFRGIVFFRRWLYRIQFKKSHRFNVPVIVIGNITVGGTGKTPLVIWLANFLKSQGLKPGIVSRGIGGKRQLHPCWVTPGSNPVTVGDEAVLLAKRSTCPVVICIDRVAAVKELLAKSNCDVVISDDGLQHYALQRDIEIAVLDGVRQLGNRCLLPAGPLREPAARLKQVNFLVTQGETSDGYCMRLSGEDCISLKNPTVKKNLAEFAGQSVHAIAAIGNPERFFSSLKNLQVKQHSFPDHYLFKKGDLFFDDGLPVMMTEKDAVKCAAFADERHWFLPVVAHVDVELGEKILAFLREPSLRTPCFLRGEAI